MKHPNAFTLIELLLVLVIVGIVVGIAVPNFSRGYSSFNISQSVNDLNSLSRWSQAMAVAKRTTYAIAFAKDRRSYRAVVKAEGEGPEWVAVKTSAGRPRLLAEELRLETSKDVVRFFPDGTVDPVRIEISMGKRTRVLSSEHVRGALLVIDE